MAAAVSTSASAVHPTGRSPKRAALPPRIWSQSCGHGARRPVRGDVLEGTTLVTATASSGAAGGSPGSRPPGGGSTALGALERLAGGGTNGRLVRSLIEAGLREFRTNAEEAADIWLNLPPRELTDTVAPAELADPDSKFVQVGDVTVHYKEAWGGGDGPSSGREEPGSPPAPTLVLLHGLAGSTFSWRLVMEDLARSVPGGRCRIIAYDRPPFGLTTRPLEVSEGSNPYTSAGAGSFTLRLMDALSIRSAVLVGHSAGAGVAVEAALQAPGRVDALILVSPAVFVSGDFVRNADLRSQLRLLYIRTLLSVPGANLNYIRSQYMKRKESVLAKKSFGYFDESTITDEVVEGYLKPMKARDWDKGALMQSQNLNFEPLGDRLNDIKVPVLVVQGLQDRAVTAEAAEALVRHLKHVTPTTYYPIDCCGHLPPEEYPSKFVEVTSNFVTELFGLGPTGSRSSSELQLASAVASTQHQV